MVTIVVRAERTITVFAATDALTVGDRIHSADLTLLKVRLDSAAGLYLTPTRVPSEGVLVTRTVVAGELIPASAVGAVDGERVTSLVVTLRGLLSESVTAGSVVDVWAAPQEDNARFAPPGIVVAGATVVRIVENSGMLATREAPMVEILVPKSAVSSVLEAIANSDAVSLVAVNANVADDPSVADPAADSAADSAADRAADPEAEQ
jgi:hypothetical protein